MVPKTRLFYIASILVTVTTLIFICGATISRANSPVEIRFWHAMGRSRGRVLNELVDRFNRANPGIVVKAAEQGAALAAVSGCVAEMKLSITSINGRYDKNNDAIVEVTVSLTNRQDIEVLINKIRSHPKIYDVRRMAN